ncbi:MAG: PQQ-binding-like beta-propeller repeat protein [Bacteriovoracaceae bacterium]|nr:PQQ-binding-like beta-propeller repeat protein [Bacteriovoracaceae bacterium]
MSFISFFLCCFLFFSCAFTPLERASSSLKVKWSKNFEPAFSSGNRGIGMAEPFIFQNILYLATPQKVFTAQDVKTGRILWQVQEDYPVTAGATIWEDKVLYVNQKGELIIRNALSGKLEQTIELGGSAQEAGTLWDGRLFIHLKNHSVVSVDLKALKILWVYKKSISYITTLHKISHPTIYQDKVLVGFADGSLVALKLETGDLLWEQKLTLATKFIDVDTTPVLLGDILFACSAADMLTAINPQTGEIIQKFNYSLYRAPLVYAGDLFLGTMDGKIIQITPQGTEKLKVQMTTKAITGMKIWKDKLVVTSADGVLRILHPQTLKEEKHFFYGGKDSVVYTDFALEEDLLAIYTNRHHLYVLNPF